MLSDPDLQVWLASQMLEINTARPLSGGCVASCYELNLSDGRACFLKQHPGDIAGQFAAEAAGLKALAASSGLRVPAVIWYSDNSLLLEDVPPAATRAADFWEQLGIGLAQQHKQTLAQFGFQRDTFCGGTRQPNPLISDGYRFFAEQRLLYLAKIAVDNELLSTRAFAQVEQLCTRLPELIPEQAPALLHGDLWYGNVHTGPSGEPVLIDPAAYQGWPEADLAMTLLFGGFDDRFYEVYRAHHPLQPGWRERAALYNLWHLLNHLTLFGRSYLQEVEATLRRYVG